MNTILRGTAANETDVNFVDQYGNIAFMKVVARGYKEAAKSLLSYGADVNAVGEGGNTALMVAASRNDVEMAKLLLHLGADVNIVDENGNTALMVAASRNDVRNDVEMIKLLLEHKADVDIKNKNGDTALYIALSQENKEAAKILIYYHYKLGLYTPNKHGKIAIDIAEEKGFTDILQDIEKHVKVTDEWFEHQGILLKMPHFFKTLTDSFKTTFLNRFSDYVDPNFVGIINNSQDSEAVPNILSAVLREESNRGSGLEGQITLIQSQLQLQLQSDLYKAHKAWECKYRRQTLNAYQVFDIFLPTLEHLNKFEKEVSEIQVNTAKSDAVIQSTKMEELLKHWQQQLHQQPPRQQQQQQQQGAEARATTATTPATSPANAFAQNSAQNQGGQSQGASRNP